MRVTALGSAGHSSMPDEVDYAVPVLSELLQAAWSASGPAARVLPPTSRDARRGCSARGATSARVEIDEAVERVAALHPALRELVAPLFSTTIAPTRLHGSDALNAFPARASVDCDCRGAAGHDAGVNPRRTRRGVGNRPGLRTRVLLTRSSVAPSPPSDHPLYAACERPPSPRHDPDAVAAAHHLYRLHRLPLRPGIVGLGGVRLLAHALELRTRSGARPCMATMSAYTATISVTRHLFHLEACHTLLQGG